MKKYVFIVLIAFLSVYVKANPFSSQLEEVRVFLSGAEITRSATADIPAGIGEVVFSGLAANIDPNSIQLKGEGPFTILSVSHRNNYMQPPAVSREVERLTDSLELVNEQIARSEATLKVYEEEQSLLLANKSPGGNAGLTVAELGELADFFRTRMVAVKELQLKSQAEVKLLQERQRRLRQQIAEIAQARNNNVSEIVITTSASRATKGNFTFSYVAQNAGWNAMYDIRANDTGSPVELLMKAAVHQNTGEDWSNVTMTLSTGTPLSRRVAPTPEPWFLRFIQPLAERVGGIEVHSQVAEYATDNEMVPDMVLDEALTMPELIAVSETYTTQEYQITTPFSVPSGPQPRMVEVRKAEVPAQFTWYAVPRMESDAFLIARLTNWDEFVVLPGEAGVFFENSWVGKTMLNPSQAGDTLTVSMGADRSVSVERSRLEEFSKTGILGRKKTETIAWEILIRNGKSRTVDIEIKDQIPVSTDAEIEITLEESSKARHEENTGILTWKLSLQPGETQKREFRYSVRYPSDKVLRLE